jgi:hypothetical protein
MAKTFVVYERRGEIVVPRAAKLVARSWVAGKPEGWKVQRGPEIPWSELYAGHCAWVGEQIEKHREHVKRERSRRLEKRKPVAA